MRVVARDNAAVALYWLLLSALWLAIPGCGGRPPTADQTIERYSQKLRETVANRVPQEDRRAQMLQIVAEVEHLQRRFSQETTTFVADYRKLNVDYDSSRPAYDQLFADYRAKRVAARNEALNLHFQLASLAKSDEWNAIVKAEAKLYEKAATASAQQAQAL